MKKNVQKMFKDNLRIATWLGGKYRWAKEINLLLDHDKLLYVEPFVGMANVLLNADEFPCELVNDKDYGTINLIKQCQEDFQSVIDIFKEYPIEKTYFEMFRGLKNLGYVGMNQFDIALAELYLTSYSFDANRMNMRFVDSKHDEARQKLYDRTCRMLDINAARVQERLQGVTITNHDALDVIRELKDDSDAMLYIDSPYEYSTMGPRKDLYYERFTTEDQVAMLNLIKDSKASVMVSGYRGGDYLYERYLTKDAGWHCWMLDSKVNMACRTGVEHKGSTQEYLWTNYVPDELGLSIIHSGDIALTQHEADLLAGARCLTT
ncbi:MAG: DNA adenine methylase [Butyrivibrio sp.]|uniref:DNA adenine methylase n=1 Tax=Butyrivibrio sp. TaxID=28121 RepID=UPI001B017EE5|nr:DNA adenine methylase [Butyrivibrio sp.]MBO6240756.1 DNA adenine methylase [Butyrivibrio sp.]